MPPAFRPPGRRTSRDVLRRLRASVEPLPVLILPGQAAEGNLVSGGGGRIRTSEG